MHILFDVLFLAIGGLIIFNCYRRGFLRSVVHSLKTVLAFVFAYFFGTMLGSLICEKLVGPPVREWVYGKLEALYASTAGSLDAESVMAEFPSFLVNDDLREKLNGMQGSSEELLNTMTDSIATPAATVISNILGYIGVFVISLVLLWVAAVILTKLMERITLLDRINKILGAVLGLLIALFVMFAISSVMKLFFGNTDLYTDTLLIEAFGNSSFLNVFRFLNIGDTMLSGLVS